MTVDVWRHGPIYLRPIGADDVSDAWVRGLNDPDVVRRTEARHTAWTVESVREYAEREASSRDSVLLGVFLSEGDRHIGNVRLSGWDRTHRRVELGILLFDRSTWGLGYGTEALDAACEYAFGELGVHKVCADYYADNTASARMFEKAGFVPQGVFADHFLTEEGWCDSVRVARFEPREGE